ncbi:MAG: hypothetical protein QXY18_02910 [Nitrososphaerota archaeon]
MFERLLRNLKTIKNNMQLITEDKKLYDVAKGYVTTYRVKELI